MTLESFALSPTALPDDVPDGVVDVLRLGVGSGWCRVYGARQVERARRYSWIVFVLFAALATLFGIFPGVWFEESADMGRDVKWLVTSYAIVAVVLTLAIAPTAYRRGERWAWLAFWAWPLFFVIHGIVFFPVDFAFAALGVAALLVSRRRDAWFADRP